MDYKIITLKDLEGNDQISLSGLQNWLHPHSESIILFWWTLWILTLLFLLIKFIIKPVINNLME